MIDRFPHTLLQLSDAEIGDFPPHNSGVVAYLILGRWFSTAYPRHEPDENLKHLSQSLKLHPYLCVPHHKLAHLLPSPLDDRSQTPHHPQA